MEDAPFGRAIGLAEDPAVRTIPAPKTGLIFFRLALSNSTLHTRHPYRGGSAVSFATRR